VWLGGWGGEEQGECVSASSPAQPPATVTHMQQPRTLSSHKYFSQHTHPSNNGQGHVLHQRRQLEVSCRNGWAGVCGSCSVTRWCQLCSKNS
jgi:hypothetical protein